MDPSLRMLVTLLPEIVIIGVATFMFVGSAFGRRESNWTYVGLFGLALAGLILGFVTWPSMTARQLSGVGVPFNSGPVVLDALSLSLRILAVFSGFALVCAGSLGGGKRLSGEYLGCLLMATAGVMLSCAATDIVLLFLGLELISIPTYVLLFLGSPPSQSQRAGESTIKYFLLSIVSSGILLYGLTLIYGAAGSTSLPEIAAALRASDALGLLPNIALVLVFAGLCFKIAAVPFHFYAPDVYQGTSSGNAGVLAVLPKIAGIVVLVRLVAVALPGVEAYAWQLALVVAALTMTLGNLAALWQSNVRRMLAYSSIAHSGYMLVGLVSAFALAEVGGGRQDGLTAMLFYLAVYAIATAGTFAALAYLGGRRQEINDVDDLAGLLKTRPFVAGLISLFMFSLTGIPPLAGFWGKLSLFGGLLHAAWSVDEVTRGWLLGLAILGMLNAAASAGYYLRIVGVMCFGGPTGERQTGGGSSEALFGASVCGLLVLVVGILPSVVMTQARQAGRAAVTTTQTYQPYPLEDSVEAESNELGDAVSLK